MSFSIKLIHIFELGSLKTPPDILRSSTVPVLLSSGNNTSVLQSESFLSINFIDNYTNFQNNEIQVYKKSTYILQAYLLVFKTVEENELEQVFNYFWNDFLETNVVIIVPRNDCVHIYSYDPFSEGLCRKINILKLHKFCENEETFLKVFPRHFNNFNKCKIKEITIDEDFTEINILAHFADHLNFTIESFEETELLEDIDQRNFDIFFGAKILSVQRAETFAYGFPYNEISMFMFLKKETDLKTSWEILVQPFDKASWILFWTSGIIGTISLSIINKSQVSEVLLEMIGFLFGSPVNLTPKRFNIRFQYFCWMLLGLIFSSGHHAIFFNILKSDMKRPLPKTFKDIVRTNYTRKIIVYETINEHMLSIVNNLLNFEYSMKPGEEVVSAIIESKEKFLGLCSEGLVLASLDFVNLIYVLKERFFMILVTIFFRKGSFFLQYFDDFILKILQSGLLDKWDDDIFEIIKVSFENENRNVLYALSMHQLGGIFEIWIIFIAICCIVFFGEILICKINK